MSLLDSQLWHLLGTVLDCKADYQSNDLHLFLQIRKKVEMCHSRCYEGRGKQSSSLHTASPCFTLFVSPLLSVCLYLSVFLPPFLLPSLSPSVSSMSPFLSSSLPHSANQSCLLHCMKKVKKQEQSGSWDARLNPQHFLFVYIN